MFYTKYRIFEDGMEIMVPSMIKTASSLVSSQYLWQSDDKRILINAVQGCSKLTELDIDNRLDSYYYEFSKAVNGFECIHIKKIRIYGKNYGEIRYLSHMKGYDLFNMFILGTYEGRELVFTIQCLEAYAEYNMHIFENISDSIRVIKKSPNIIDESPNNEKNIGLKLIYTGNNKNITIDIDKDEFIIGRDIVSDTSNAVSRKHCMIIKMNGKYFVQDLKSSNHTLVNGIMIPPYELMELYENDILSMASMDFRVKHYSPIAR
jgi:hypothetical protein